MAGPSHPPLPPYLVSWALGSLAFTSPIVLSLLLTLLRLILAISSAQSSIDGAKQNLASSCRGLEQASSAAASFPHYLAGNMNNGTAVAAEAIVHGLGTVLDMSVLGVEQLLIFVVELYRSMYLCLADLVVRGSLALAIDATEEFSAFINSTFNEVRSGVQSAINGADTVLDTAVSGLNLLPGVNIDSPDIAMPDLSFLENVSLPSDFMDSLVTLNASLPTLDELRDKMNDVISIPFEAVRADINTTLKNATVDRNLLPVPAKETMAFCQDLDLSFVDNVGNEIVKVAQYAIIGICVIIVLFIGALVFQHRMWYNSLVGYVNVSRLAWAEDMGVAQSQQQSYHLPTGHGGGIGRSDVDRIWSTATLMGFVAASTNPILRTFVPWVSNRVPPLKRSPRARSNFTWFMAYVTYLPALLLLLVAVLGLLTNEIQLAALKPTEARAQGQVDEGLSSIRGSIIDSLNDRTRNSSIAYANGTNTVLLGVQNGINDDMFGWVNSSTTTLNDTLVEFYAGLTGAINSTFGGTVFNGPAQDLVRCLIGYKIEAVSTALTWLHENAHVTLPLVRDDVFMLSEASSQELVSSLDSPDGSESSASSVVGKMVDSYRDALKTERKAFFFLLGLYGLVVLFALLALLWHEVLGPKWRSRKAGSASALPSEKEKDAWEAQASDVHGDSNDVWYHKAFKALHPRSIGADADRDNVSERKRNPSWIKRLTLQDRNLGATASPPPPVYASAPHMSRSTSTLLPYARDTPDGSPSLHPSEHGHSPGLRQNTTVPFADLIDPDFAFPAPPSNATRHPYVHNLQDPFSSPFDGPLGT